MYDTVDSPSAGITIPVFARDGETAYERALQPIMASWPIDHDDVFVPTAFGRTHVIVSGPHSAPPVVLLHALFATATSWYRNVEALSAEHRTYCIDVIGEANESRPTRPIASLDDFMAWFRDTVDGLGIDDFALIGNSYGGFTAAHYAMRLGNRVRKLALIGPAATIHSMWPFTAHMFLPKGLYLAAPRLPGRDRVMETAIDWMHAGLPPDPLWGPLFNVTMNHGRLINRVFPRVYTRDELAGIASPVLLAFGEREVVYGDLDEVIAKARDLMPNADIAVIPDAHHIAALANPDAANETLLRFLG